MRSKITPTNCSQRSALNTAIYIVLLSHTIWSLQFNANVMRYTFFNLKMQLEHNFYCITNTMLLLLLLIGGRHSGLRTDFLVVNDD